MAKAPKRKFEIPENPEGFLHDFQGLLCFHRPSVIWMPRSSMMSEIGQLGLTMEQAEDIILNVLRADHCRRGPEPDDHAPETGKVCIFRCPVEGQDAYVKIGLELAKGSRNGLIGKIWSFKTWTAM
jgi:hypothetical protein